MTRRGGREPRPRRGGVWLALIWLAASGTGWAAEVARSLDAYALFASERLRARSLHVASGDVGVEAGVLESHAPVDAPSSIVAAEVVHLMPTSRCAALFATGIDQDAPACPLDGVFPPGPVVGALDDACGMASGLPACAPANPVTVDAAESRTLPPGVYGDLVVRKGQVVLGAGRYVFCSVRAGRQSRMVAPADADVVVSGDFVLAAGGALLSADESTPGATVSIQGSRVALARGARVDGRFCAPEAQLVVGEQSTLVGRFAARTIRTGRVSVTGLPLGPGTTSTSTPSTSTVPPTTSSTSTTVSTSTSTRPPTTSTSTSSTSSSTSSTFIGTLPTTSTSTSSTTTTIAGSTTTSSSSSTSTSPTSSTTTGPPTTTTSTTRPTAVCGNQIVEPGETCDDGNTRDGDSCPSNCRIEACTLVPGTARVFTVNFTPPTGADVAGITVLVDYPEGKVAIAGSGADTSVRAAITNLPTGALGTPNDLDYAVREVVASFSPIPAGRLFTLTLQGCQGATPPAASEFGCRVEDAADQLGLPVDGVTCTVQ